ncbi:PaaX family transcriptional regulator [Quadrisphaera oryzae]|uniref:PaaX family transcriptional regulator n=1 Tax=Quadrisphaera TaxID=317661 RepID=UPI0016477E78|nr:phenylacetic acid-responsive transcriptional repressor [Quadrisphaera sp. RL12-1S]
MTAAPRSLVLDLFGDYLRYTGGEVLLGHMTELLGAFDVAPATVRMTLSRLRREGWFTTRRIGRETVYRLSDEMLALLEQGRRRIFAVPAQEWDRTWTMLIYGLAEADRSGRDELRRTLAWHGFGQMATSTWLAPGDRRAEIEAATAELLGGELAQRTDVFTCASRDHEHDRALAARCWDLPALAAEYREFIEANAELAAHPERLEGAAALVARTQLVSTYRHFPFKDPRLPVELCPSDWPGQRAWELFTRTHAALGPAARAHVESVVQTEVPEPPAVT